jgi:hypothetical protein
MPLKIQSKIEKKLFFSEEKGRYFLSPLLCFRLVLNEKSRELRRGQN